MDEVVRDMKKFAHAYLDDLVIFSSVVLVMPFTFSFSFSKDVDLLLVSFSKDVDLLLV